MHHLYEIKQNKWFLVKIANNFGPRDPTSWSELPIRSSTSQKAAKKKFTINLHVKPLGGFRGFVGTLGVSNLFPVPAILIRVKLMFSLKVKVKHSCNFYNIDLKLWGGGGRDGEVLVVGMPVMFRVKKPARNRWECRASRAEWGR